MWRLVSRPSCLEIQEFATVCETGMTVHSTSLLAKLPILTVRFTKIRHHTHVLPTPHNVLPTPHIGNEHLQRRQLWARPYRQLTLTPSSIYLIRRLDDYQFRVSGGNRLLYAGPVFCFTKPTRRNVIHLRPALFRDRYRDRSDFTGEVWTRPSLESAALPTIKGRVWLWAAIILVTTNRAVQSGQEDTYDGELLQRICHAWTC